MSAGLFLIALSGRHPTPTHRSVYSRGGAGTRYEGGSCLQFGEAETVCQLGRKGARQSRRIQDPASKPGNRVNQLRCGADRRDTGGVGHLQKTQLG